MPLARRFLKILCDGGLSGYSACVLKRRLYFFLISLATLLVLGQRASAQPPLAVDVWSTPDGLPQSSVVALTQTRDGYLWLGTLNGLVRFDGNSFTRFNVNNTPGLPGNGIVFLFEDSQTNLWVGTDSGGLGRMERGGLKTVDRPGTGVVVAAFEDESGTVWFATNDRKFFCWRLGVIERSPVLYPAQLRFLTLRAYHLIHSEAGGVSWQLDKGRVEKFRGSKRESDFGPLPWGNAIITALAQDDAGNLIVGTRGAGVFWFAADGTYRRITRAEGLSQDFVLSLCFDTEGNLWVGTDGGGLDRVRKKIFTAPEALSGGVAQSVEEDEQGGLWTAFNLRGLIYWRTNEAQAFKIPADNAAWCVLADRRGQVWAGTSGQGLFRLQDGGFQPVPEAAQAGQKIFCLLESRSGAVWVGGESGLARYDGQSWNFFALPAGRIPGPVRALAEDAAGVIWVGTENEGLFNVVDARLEPVKAPVKSVSCLLVAGDGTLWVGTPAHGLVRWVSGAWHTFSSTQNGLVNDDIGSLAEDAEGNLWIGSFEGLVRLGKKSVGEVVSGSAAKLSCRTFLTRECSAGAQPAALRARDGRLWFPTIEGAVAVNPADLKINSNPPPVIIESVLIDGVELKTNLLASGWSAAVTLAPQNEQLEIRFTALSFSAPKGSALGVRFRFSLVEADTRAEAASFTDIGGERVVRLPRLAPGAYRFQVIACNEDGVWNRAGATLAITVQPPFWRTPGFIITGILALLGALAGIIYLVSTAKLKRQLRAAQQKELIEKERARIARDLHDQLGANLTQVTLLGEMAEMDKELPGEVEQHAQQICVTARETTRALDEIVWAVNPSNDTLEGLANYACKYAQDYFALAGVSFRAELPPNLPPAPILPEVRHNVFLAFKEAVNNVVKHAHATEARVKLTWQPGLFVLTIADNGKGLGDLTGKELRNGMKNMKRRLADVRGDFEIVPGENGGTVVRLSVPLARS